MASGVLSSDNFGARVHGKMVLNRLVHGSGGGPFSRKTDSENMNLTQAADRDGSRAGPAKAKRQPDPI
ncbi:MAG: hypothetical protein ACI8PT_003701 [Gammaproteobacteria bacterium]|jgi:hypothetical protein